MNKFAYGIAFNLTLLANASPMQLNFLDMSTKQRDLLSGKDYLLRQTDQGMSKDALAQYSVTWTQTGGAPKFYKEEFHYKSSLQTETLETNIKTAAHEMKHAGGFKKYMRRKNRTSFTSGSPEYPAILRNNGGLLAYEAYLTALGIFGSSEAHGRLVAFGLAGIGVKYALGKNTSYNEEIRAYRFEGKINSIVSPRRSTTQIDADLKVAQEEQSQAGTFLERFYVGYPGPEKRDLIRLEEEKNFAVNGASLFTPQYVRGIHDKTRDNLIGLKLPLYRAV